MKVLVTAVIAITIHLLLAWWLTPLAALAGGVWKGRGGWWLGMSALLLSWGGAVVYSYLINPLPFGRMTTTMGGVLGNLPAVAVVAATLVIGALLGFLGGLAGTQLRLLASPR